MNAGWEHLPPVILASGSPRRAELLGQLGLPFQVLVSASPEMAEEHLTPAEICLLNAHRKARAVARQHPDALVLGADTEVVLGVEVFGKPADLRAAEAMLERLQGRTHEVITGVSLIHLRAHREQLFAERTLVTFRPLSRRQIQGYLALIHPLDKAGAYALQEHGEKIVASVAGSASNVVGLPLERLRQVLGNWPRPANR